MFRLDILEKGNNVIFNDLQGYLESKKKVSLWKPKDKKNEIEKGIWNETYLKNLHNTLKLFRYKNMSKRKSIKKQSLELNREKLLENLEYQEDHNSIIFQKTIKGRSIQTMIEKGIQNFGTIIEDAKKEFSKFIIGQKSANIEIKQIEERLKNDPVLQEDLKKIEPKQTRNYITSLEKELQRLQSEKRAHALFLLAERERYYREALKFQDERTVEETFKKDDVVLYLENVLLEGIQSEDNSRKFIHGLIQKIDQGASMNVIGSNSQEIAEREQFVEHLYVETNCQIIEKENIKRFRSKQEDLLQTIHVEMFKDEYLFKELEEQKEFCSDLINELIERATLHEKYLDHQESFEAEELASEIVKKILDEIHCYETTSSSLNETDETESSSDKRTEVLVEQVVHNVLLDVFDDKSSDSLN